MIFCRYKDNQLTECDGKLDVLKELVSTKDSEIISLTNQVRLTFESVKVILTLREILRSWQTGFFSKRDSFFRN